MRKQVIAALVDGGEDDILQSTVFYVVSARSMHHRQVCGYVFIDTFHFQKLLIGSFQHIMQLAEMIQQFMGKGIGILPGNAVEKQQLQGIDLAEMIQPFLQKAILPFSVRLLLCGGILAATAERTTLSAGTLAAAFLSLLLCSLLCTALTVLLSQSRMGLALWLALPLIGLLLCGGLLPRAMLPYTAALLGRYTPQGMLCTTLAPLYGGASGALPFGGLALWCAVLLLLARRYVSRLLRKGGAPA